MALIRCPQCDTGHELDDALLQGGKRRVRCASCRTIWLAEMPPAPDDDWGDALATDSPEPGKPSEPQSQGDIDSLFDTPFKGTEPQSQGTIDSLFDAPTPEAPKSLGDINSLFAESAKPAAVAEPIVTAPQSVAPQVATTTDDSLDAAAERRSERRRRAAPPPPVASPPPPPPNKAGSIAVMFLAASVGTLATLMIFRHDVARLFPSTGSAFEAVGLSTKDVGLFFEDVRSRIAREDGRETLEVVGTIINKTNKRQLLPMLRLSIQGEAGQELYVWTATADQADIGPLDRVKFRRRLASPPSESHQVEVRFVAAQDVVASVR